MNKSHVHLNFRSLLIFCIIGAALICIGGCFVKSSSTCGGDTCEGVGEAGNIQYPDATPADSPSENQQAQSNATLTEGKVTSDASKEHKNETFAMPSSTTIVIYTMPTCPHCQELKNFLSQKGIDYRNIEVDIDPIGLQEMHRISNQTKVPVIVIGNNVIVGFDPKILEEKLRKAGFL